MSAVALEEFLRAIGMMLELFAEAGEPRKPSDIEIQPLNPILDDASMDGS